MAKSIGSLSMSLSAKTAKFEAGMRRSSKTLKGVRKQAGATGKAIAKFGGMLAAAAGGAAVGLFVKSQFSAIDATAKLSAQLQLSIADLKGFELGAKLSGASTEVINKGLQTFVKRLGEMKAGVGEGIRGLEQFGLSASDFGGKTTGDSVRIFADAIARIPDAAGKAALANAAFGRSGQQLLTFFEKGGKGIDGFVKEAKRLGLVFSEAEGQKVQDFNDALERLKSVFTGLAQNAAIALADLQPVIDAMTSGISVTKQWFGELSNGTKTVIKTAAMIGLVGTAILATTIALQAAIPWVIAHTAAVAAAAISLGAWVAAKISALALMGPAGWAILAGATIATGAAIGATAGLIKNFADDMEAATVANKTNTASLQANEEELKAQARALSNTNGIKSRIAEHKKVTAITNKLTDAMLKLNETDRGTTLRKFLATTKLVGEELTFATQKINKAFDLKDKAQKAKRDIQTIKSALDSLTENAKNLGKSDFDITLEKMKAAGASGQQILDALNAKFRSKTFDALKKNAQALADLSGRQFGSQTNIAAVSKGSIGSAAARQSTRSTFAKLLKRQEEETKLSKERNELLRDATNAGLTGSQINSATTISM